MTAKVVSNTFVSLPDERMPTLIGQVLAQGRADETRLVDHTIFVSAPPQPHEYRAAPAPGSAPPTAGYAAPRPSPPTTDWRNSPTIVLDESAAAAPSTYRSSLVRKSLPSGFTVHTYRVEEPIGEGGFAITYRATDTRVARRVALKELFLNGHCTRADDLSITSTHAPDTSDPFQWALWFFSEEARIASSLRHQGIVTMLEFFKTNGTAYIAYQLLTGLDLQRWANERQHKLPHGEAVELLRRCAEALQFVHKRGFVHGDIKPGNIFVDSETSAPVLIDFGSAAEIGKPRAGQYIAASDGFSPIEQYSRNSIPDPRIDVYSLCATIYWVLTGSAPPDARSRANQDTLVSLDKAVSPEFRVGSRLARVVEKGLSLEPRERYPDTKALIDDLFPRVYLSATGYSSTPRGDKVFLSYRREDSAHFSGRLLDFLEMRLGADQVFFDAMSIPHGLDFWDYIKSNLQECAVLLAIVGPRWTEMLNERRKRWYKPWIGRDFVADEIAAAIELQLPILPVLFDGAPMPREAALPRELKLLPSLNAALIGSGKAFRVGADGLCDQISKIRSDFYAKRS